ncbi:monovalent cation:proton antiporter family protein [Halalkalibacter urbisdiaboli]|uniref:monovalent cation:proton antiporter family protein n=1 Tax=Halalkalibacter urbisdiaboli TaxID=1960589 RepID=UPI000B44EB09|nr:monovalent cation:proton antiporter family protein [Halalkalibacter urbisdiaboli]
MEEHVAVTSLVVVVLVAFLIPVLLHKLKLRIIPVVVAEIIAGMVIGRSGFNLVSQDIWLETLSLLGFIFLMFLSGLEIDFSAFAGKGRKRLLQNGIKEPNTFIAATLVFVLIFGLSYALSLLFVAIGFLENAFLMTLIISTISLGVVVPTLKEEHLMKTAVGQVILLVAVIADLVTMILLAVFVSIYAEDSGNMWLLLILFAAGVLLYFVGKKFRDQTYLETMTKGTIQLDTRAIFTLIILLVALSESVGAENILGAFLAGVLVSLLSPNPEMVHKLDSFGYGFLIPIFFVMVGVELDIWALFENREVLLLIPLLFIALLMSKLLPSLLLLRWYDWKTAVGAGFLLTSTLSLVIAAASIGERIGVITEELSSALILVAVISCIVTPIAFKKLFPKQETGHEKKKLFIIGANQLTLPITLQIDSEAYETRLFHTKKQEQEGIESSFHIEELAAFTKGELERVEAFDADILVLATGDEKTNFKLAIEAKETFGTERVIARVESNLYQSRLEACGVSVFSVFFSNQAVLRAMIQSPNVVDLFEKKENGLYQIQMKNRVYQGRKLRDFPHLGDTVFVRIFRGNESLVPHGDTELQVGDHIIVTGGKEHVRKLREIFS